MGEHLALFVSLFLCNRHWFNWVLGANLGIACVAFALFLTLAVPIFP
jgi:hypothetical protein